MTTVGILGLGIEGQAAIRYFLTHTNFNIISIDQQANQSRSISGMPQDPRLTTRGDDPTSLRDVTILLRSPGISPRHPIITTAEHTKVPITTPTGYWLEHHAPASTITVTGTKGKSTTVGLLAHLLCTLGENAAPLGNIGSPPLDSDVASMPSPVIELSSYMMHDLPLRGHFHIITNLYREHMTWHGTETAYRSAKLRPFLQQPPAPGLTLQSVVNAENLPSTISIAEDHVQINGTTLIAEGNSITPHQYNDIFLSSGTLLGLRMAVCAALTRYNARTIFESLPAALRRYRGLPHRQEIIPSSDGRIWVNDALATVPEATITAVNRWASIPMTLLLGGADRGQDFSALAHLAAAYPSLKVIIFGSTLVKTAKCLRRSGAHFIEAEDFKTALTCAAQITPRDGVVLFSPAAASEPPHKDYNERGKIFAEMAADA